MCCWKFGLLNHVHGPVQAALERLLQQLVAVQNEWLKANGGFGEPFKLQHHLLPPSSHKVTHAAQHANGNSAPAPMDRD
jgi:hypothetical protein